MDFAIVLLIVLIIAFYVAAIIGFWKAFEKVGHPGWAAIIPIYNIFIVCKMADKPGWWVLSMLIPIVSLVILVILSLQVARNFGKSVAFGWGLAILPYVFGMILGLGDAQWQREPAQ